MPADKVRRTGGPVAGPGPALAPTAAEAKAEAPAAAPAAAPAKAKAPRYTVVREETIETKQGPALVIEVVLAGSDTSHTFSWTPDCPSHEDAHFQLRAWAKAEVKARG